MGKLKPANILLEKHLREMDLTFSKELRFDLKRRWRADYWLTNVRKNGLNIIIEIHGSVYAQGRHTRGKGFEDDRVKMNTAQMLGYMVLEFSTGQVLQGEAKEFLRTWLAGVSS